MDTIPVHIRLPRSLHDRALLLQAEQQRGTARRVKLAPILIELIEGGLAAKEAK